MIGGSIHRDIDSYVDVDLDTDTAAARDEGV